MRLKSSNIFIIVGILLLIIFRNWFTKSLLSAPDFSYLYAQRIGNFSWFPHLWSSMSGGGMGGVTQGSLNLDTYLGFGIRLLVLTLHVPWSLGYRLLFFWPFLVVGTISSYLLCTIFVKNKSLASIGALVYMTNTYVLMLSGGGQLGLVIAYAFVPLVMYSFVLRKIPLFTLSSIFLILFDLRYSYLLYGALVLYGLLVIPKNKWWETVKMFIGPTLFIASIHSFWLIPSFLARSFGLPSGYGDPGWLSFLSWAEFSKTISLLHPNWPENIFGLTHFMQPEFLILPLLVFGSLLLTTAQQKQKLLPEIRFFFILLITSAFLAKGVKPPFGNVFEWMFVHVPLFNGFRDPTKFYLLTVLSYTVLIPYALQLVTEFTFVKPLKAFAKFVRYIPYLFILFWMVTLLPFFTGYVKGTFGQTVVPSEYFDFEKVLSSQPGFSRTLAVPWRHRFVFQSENHPIVDARDLFTLQEPKKIADAFDDPGTEKKLKDMAIKYIVIPHDSTNEIFLTDRKYDSQMRDYVVARLDRVPYLVKHKDYVNLTIYEYTRPTDHMYSILPNTDYEVYASRQINSGVYHVTITSSKRPLQIIFSEAFDSAWELWDGKEIVKSQKTKEGLNSFIVNNRITSEMTLSYKNEKFLHTGFMATGIVLLLTLLYLYMKLAKRMGWGVRVHACIVVCILGMWLYLHRSSNTKNILYDEHVWKSPEWTLVSDMGAHTTRYVSRYGGSQMKFSLNGSGTLVIEASSPNDEKDAQGLDIYVDGEYHSMVTPLKNVNLRIPISSDKTPHAVKILHYCASTLSVCEIAIHSLLIETPMKLSETQIIQQKTIAIIGDSITSSFGNKNYSYMLADRLGFRLHNAGIFGSLVSKDPTWDSASDRYDEDIMKFTPNVVIVFLGTNDLGHLIPIEVFQKNYLSMISTMQKHMPHTTLIAMGLLRRQDFPVWQIKQYSQVIASVASELGVVYIDPYNWLDVSDFQDVVHPSVASQQKLANKFYDAVAATLETQQSSR